MMSWNVNGLRGRATELKKVLDEKSIDVCLVQETKLPPGDQTFIPGYTINHIARDDGSCTHGVAVIIRDGVPYKILEEDHTATQDTETQTISVRIWDGEAKSHVDAVNIYRPPSLDANIFDANAIRTGDHRVYVADINGHHPDWDDIMDPDTIGNNFSEWTDDKNILILNDGNPTYIHNGNGGRSAPDIACVSADLVSRTEWQLDDEGHGSDHQPMYLKIEMAKPMNKFVGKGKANFKRADWDEFSKRVEVALSNLKKKSVSITNSLLVKAINEADDLFVPKKNRKKAKPWWDRRMGELTKKRNYARKRAHLSEAERKDYLIREKECKAYANKAKQDCFRTKVGSMDFRKGTYNGWRLIQGMRGESRRSNNEAILHKGKLLITEIQKAEAFGATYAEVSRLPSDKRDRKLVREIRHRMEKAEYWEDIDYVKAFSMEELKRAIKKLPDNKACGHDKVANEHIKHLGENSLVALLWLINRSWKTSEIPHSWRKATIIPLLKKGKKAKELGSYRPVALTSCIGKLAERLIKRRITAMVEDKGLLNNNQAGFRSFHSTATQLGRVVKYVFDGMQEKKAKNSVLTLFDFSRAYDKVWRNKLLVKMLDKGIHGQIINWVRIFLSDRRARVQFESATSKYRKMQQGLPQGSVLSPLLFLFFIDDLPDMLIKENCLISAFADDVAAVIQCDSIEECEEQTQQCVDKMTEWANSNRMILSKEKCEMLLFTTNSKRANHQLDVRINDVTLKTNKNPRFLGIHFDRCLSFGHHAKVVKKASNDKIRLLKCLKRAGIEEEDAKVVFRGLIETAIGYGSEIWLSGACKTARDKMESIQCEGLRIALGLMRGTSRKVILRESDDVSILNNADARAAIHKEKCLRLPPEHPARQSVEKETRKIPSGPREGQLRLKKNCWTEEARKWSDELSKWPREESCLKRKIHDWSIKEDRVTFASETRRPITAMTTIDEKKIIGEETIAEYTDIEVKVFTDGSVKDKKGGAGALIVWEPTAERDEQIAAAGNLSSSFWAEMTAIKIGLERFLEMCEEVALDYSGEFDGFGRIREIPNGLALFSDSKSSILKLQGGPDDQDCSLGVEIWVLLGKITNTGIRVKFQWIPSHVGLEGNEYADTLAALGSGFQQDHKDVNMKAAKAWISQKAKERESNNYVEAVRNSTGTGKSRGNTAWHWEATGGKPLSREELRSLSNEDRVLLHQLRTGECREVRRTASRYVEGLNESCPGCGQPQTVRHVLIECKEVGLAQWRRIAWNGEKSIREMVGDPKNLLRFWRGVPGGLLFTQ